MSSHSRVCIVCVVVEVSVCRLQFMTPGCSCKSPRSTSFPSNCLITSWLSSTQDKINTYSSRGTLDARDPKGRRIDEERVGVSCSTATGVLMYCSGPGSVINTISQPFLAAYVSPRCFSSITNSAANANKRAPRCQIKIY